jgi:methionine synthase I (cobalamin-dependent)
MGVSVEQAVRGLSEAGADILGSNCGNGSVTMVAIAREFRALTGLPIAIQPNAGLPEPLDGSLVYPETPEFMAEQARGLLAAGVAIIGGCCGTTPAHVRALRGIVSVMRS